MAQRQTTTPWRYLVHKKDSFPVRLSKRVRFWLWRRKPYRTRTTR